jgi:hypothetical protein
MADTTPHVKVFFDDNGTVTEVSTASPLPTTGGPGGGGGGTGGTADVQYIDGVAVPTHPIGTAIVIASGGSMVDVAADNPLPVSAAALPLPTGAATDTTLAALNTVLGLVNDAITTAGGTGTASAKLRRMTQGLDELKTLIVLATGTNVIGRVGIDQSTPGTTNLVQLPTSQVTSLQTVTANAGTNLNTSTLALESGGNLAALLTSLGAAADAIVAAGAVGSASAKLRRMTQGLDELKTLIVLAAGANVIGKVGIDQTTPGTTNLVQLPASQVTSLQTVTLTDLPPGAATESTLAASAASEAAEFALFQAGTALVNQARLTIVDDTTRTVPGQSGTATLASVTASVTSVTLAAASVAVLGSSAGRMGLIVVNDSASGTLYLAYKATAAITGASAYSYKIAPGQTWEMPSPIYSGAISGIWDVASGAARVTDLSA